MVWWLDCCTALETMTGNEVSEEAADDKDSVAEVDALMCRPLAMKVEMLRNET